MRKDLIIINSRGKVSVKKSIFDTTKLADIMKKLVEYAFKKEITDANSINNK